MLRTIFQSILDLCLPRECPACRTGHEFNTVFCRDCENELNQLIDAPRCSKCAMPSTLPDAPCAYCEGAGLAPFKKIVCLGVHKQSLKASVHRIKYEHRWPLAERLVNQLAERDDLQSMLLHTDVIVPVPLHRQRQRQRGFNQAELVARRLSVLGRNKIKVNLAAVRVVNTETQTHMPSRARRMENLQNAFVLISPDKIAGKHIVVVDDVLTTGATLVSLARALQPAKPASLSAVVLAVADPKGRQFEVI